MKITKTNVPFSYYKIYKSASLANKYANDGKKQESTMFKKRKPYVVDDEHSWWGLMNCTRVNEMECQS